MKTAQGKQCTARYERKEGYLRPHPSIVSDVCKPKKKTLKKSQSFPRRRKNDTPIPGHDALFVFPGPRRTTQSATALCFCPFSIHQYMDRATFTCLNVIACQSHHLVCCGGDNGSAGRGWVGMAVRPGLRGTQTRPQVVAGRAVTLLDNMGRRRDVAAL